MLDLLFMFRLALSRSEAAKAEAAQSLSKDFVPIGSGPIQFAK